MTKYIQFFTLTIILFALSCTALAEANSNEPGATVYRWEAPDGSVIFSDTPPEDAESASSNPNTPHVDKLTVPPISTVPAIIPKGQLKQNQKKPQPQNNNTGYEVKITNPPNEATLFQGNLQLTVNVKPTLREGHSLQLLGNGMLLAGPQTGTSFSASQLPRGEYQLIVEVIDQDSTSLATSNSITVFMKQHSVLH